MTTALTIAGSDSGGGAGIQADLKTFAALGVYGTSALTAITAQNTLGVQGVTTISGDFVAKQMRSVLNDFQVKAIKTGMLANAEIIEAIVSELKQNTTAALVVDPVMVSTSGHKLLDDNSITALTNKLIPLADIITPNAAEAAVMLATSPATSTKEARLQADKLLSHECRAVLLTGVKITSGQKAEAVDILATKDKITTFQRPWIETTNTHGTGCTLSAAIAAMLACDYPITQALNKARDYVYGAIKSAATKPSPGHGHGPVDHFFRIQKPES